MNEGQGRSREKEVYSTKVATVCFLLGMALVILGALFQGCASYPRTPAPLPPDSVPAKVLEDWTYEKQPGDETKFETTVGAARKGLIIGERYTDAVKAQNNAVDAGTEIAALYEYSIMAYDRAVEVGILNASIAASAGLAAGMFFTVLVFTMGGK